MKFFRRLRALKPLHNPSASGTANLKTAAVEPSQRSASKALITASEPEAPAFSEAYPSDQAALDIFKGGWSSCFPVELGLEAGSLDHFSDGRVPWAVEILGNLAGASILELGPFEAYNTSQLEALGAEVTAVEGSIPNFVKCLIVKNLLGLRSKFLLGDFMRLLGNSNARFDVIWASGVLYHLTAPIAFLEGLGRLSDKIFVWTQYFEPEVMAQRSDFALFPAELLQTIDYHGKTISLHGKLYLAKPTSGAYSGGAEGAAVWMELEDIFHVLRVQGFEDFTMGKNEPEYAAGPACFFVATKPGQGLAQTS